MPLADEYEEEGDDDDEYEEEEEGYEEDEAAGPVAYLEDSPSGNGKQHVVSLPAVPSARASGKKNNAPSTPPTVRSKNNVPPAASKNGVSSRNAGAAAPADKPAAGGSGKRLQVAKAVKAVRSEAKASRSFGLTAAAKQERADEIAIQKIIKVWFVCVVKFVLDKLKDKGLDKRSRGFRLFDDSKDSLIDMDELRAGFESLGLEMTVPELQMVFKKVDHNGNGQVSCTEFNSVFNDAFIAKEVGGDMGAFLSQLGQLGGAMGHDPRFQGFGSNTSMAAIENAASSFGPGGGKKKKKAAVAAVGKPKGGGGDDGDGNGGGDRDRGLIAKPNSKGVDNDDGSGGRRKPAPPGGSNSNGGSKLKFRSAGRAAIMGGAGASSDARERKRREAAASAIQKSYRRHLAQRLAHLMRMVYSGESSKTEKDSAEEMSGTKSRYRTMKRNNRWCNHEWYSLKRRSAAKTGKGKTDTKFRVQQGGVESWKTLEEVLGSEVAARLK